MNIALSQDFLDCLSKAPQATAKKIREMISKFRMGSTSVGLNYEKVQSAKDKNIHSVRVDQDYRSIVWSSPEGENFVFLWIDKHDAAYEWARARRVEVNQELGALQVYMVKQSETTAEPSAQPTMGMFDGLKDRELMRLGVPLDLVPVVRSIKDESALELCANDLPAEAYQGLFMVAAGYSFEEAVLELERPEPAALDYESEALLKTSESRSQFFLVEDDQLLEEMLEAPLDRWRVFLHPSQRALVERNWNGAVKVTGGPGTGKTVAALHRAKWLASQNVGKNQRILFTTFTKNLASDIEAFLGQICTPEELARIDVFNIDVVARRVLKQKNFTQAILFENSDEIRDLWKESLSEVSLDEFPREFYRSEWEEVIQPQQIRDLEAYKAADRRGRKVRVSRSQLLAIWKVLEHYLEQLRSRNWLESQDAYFAAANCVTDPPYDSVIVDETQDMGVPALTLIRRLCAVGLNDLFLVGDAHQSLYRRKTQVGKAGIKVQGRSKRLLLNYRTTKQIGRWASALWTDTPVSDLDEALDTLKGYRSAVSGDEPLDLRGLVPEEKLSAVRDLLKAMSPKELGRSCLAYTSNEAVQHAKSDLVSWSIPCVVLTQETESGTDEAAIKISTIHRIKGLEFDQVIVQWPHSDDDLSRALGFVAATRARRNLVVF